MNKLQKPDFRAWALKICGETELSARLKRGQLIKSQVSPDAVEDQLKIFYHELKENGLTPTEPEKPENNKTPDQPGYRYAQLRREPTKEDVINSLSRVIGSNGITDPPNETKKV